MKKEMEIIGAGPAGLIAAINLAKMGCAVTVYEEKPDVGHRFHGDFQGLENWSSKEDVTDLLERLGIDIKLFPHGEFVCQPYNEVYIYDANLNKTVLNSKKPFFYLVKRGDDPDSLDRALLKVAREAGARVVFNKRVDKFDNLENGAIIGVGPRAADVIAKGVLFKTTMADTAAVILDDNLAPKGYAYLLVYNGRATMATCMFREFKRERECFERTVEAFKRALPSLDMADEREFGGYGNFFLDKPVYENGKYYIGEAAGMQDCLWGFGMRYAMLSGYFAADCFVGGKDYAAVLKSELLPMQRVSLANRFIFERFGNIGYSGFVRWLTNGNAIEKVGRQYNPSFLKTLLYPLARWRYKSRLVDKGCHGEGCACVWCRCRKEVS